MKKFDEWDLHMFYYRVDPDIHYDIIHQLVLKHLGKDRLIKFRGAGPEDFMPEEQELYKRQLKKLSSGRKELHVDEKDEFIVSLIDFSGVQVIMVSYENSSFSIAAPYFFIKNEDIKKFLELFNQD